MNAGTLEELSEVIGKLETTALRIKADRDRFRAALIEIAKGEGPYSRDQLEHASNTIYCMKEIAKSALQDQP